MKAKKNIKKRSQLQVKEPQEQKRQEEVFLMKLFENYLHQQSYQANTIKLHSRQIKLFTTWMNQEHIQTIENLQHNDILHYIQYLQNNSLHPATINNRLGSLNLYFQFLQKEELALYNPVKTIRVKGAAKTIVQMPLTYEQMQQLYNNYKALNKTELWASNTVPAHVKNKAILAHQRNIIILGLLIWQGLHSGELQRLETEHINLDQATLYIPSTSRSNSRTLKLQTQQILSLHSYLYGDIRMQFLPKANELLVGNVRNVVNALMVELRLIEPSVKNALHIRASVILHWLRLYNKRQVQYMSGHKWIDSTEKYAVQEMESLSDALSKFHPFG